MSKLYLLTILALELPACSTSNTASESITNGATQAKVTTHWQSAGDAGCIVGNGGGACFGPLDMALADDGTAMWSSNYGCCGTSTWVKVGDGSTIILADEPLSSGGLNISNIIGSTDSGTFTGDASGYHAIEFTLQIGNVPNACATSVLDSNGGGCMPQ